MEKVAVQRWRREVFRIIRGADPRWQPACPSFSVAMLLAAVSGFGTDVSVLVELTGFSAGYITKVLKRLRKARVVVGQTLRVGWDDEGLQGVVAFVCDALTGMGRVTRSPASKRAATKKQQAKVESLESTFPRRRRVRVPLLPGAVFTPKRVKSNPRYRSFDDPTAEVLLADS